MADPVTEDFNSIAVGNPYECSTAAQWEAVGRALKCEKQMKDGDVAVSIAPRIKGLCWGR